MFKRIFARMKGILMLFAGSIALLAITLMLDFKTFEQFNFYHDVDVWSHPILLVQLAMVVIVLLLLGQVIGLSVKYYFAFKKLDVLFPNNESKRKSQHHSNDKYPPSYRAPLPPCILSRFQRERKAPTLLRKEQPPLERTFFSHTLYALFSYFLLIFFQSSLILTGTK